MRALILLLFYLFPHNCFSQDSALIVITEKKAILIAGKHGLRPKLGIKKWQDGETIACRLDTAKKVWQVSSNKITYRKWGKTTKQYESDFRRRCKNTNGCYVVRTRIIWVDAISGKVITKKRTKKVSGSYE